MKKAARPPASLDRANRAFARSHPGESGERQPVHTVYGGAHLFRSDTAPKLGALARRALEEYAPTPALLAEALGLQASEGQAYAATIHGRVKAKLEREPVEDFRIDFEDGYGHRPDAEEDGHARAAAREVARGLREGTLPPFIGIRIKPLSSELAGRGLRTLELFVTALVREARALPAGFVVTLPKVTIAEQVRAAARALAALESRHRLRKGALRLELMVETPQSILAPSGEAALPALVAAAGGRCSGAHFGTYDYTASCNITAAHQVMTHPACEFAKHVMQVSLAGTGVMLSDGATNVMPVGPHRAAPGAALTPDQVAENRAAVHRAWKLHFDDVRASLRQGFYQGWDLHPAQLPTRYAAVFSFFLEGLEAASTRLRNFIEKAAQATLVGDVFDDAATGQGLLNYFLRGVGCGAITPEEAQATGLSLDEIKTRSFLAILKGRRDGQ
ncbi:MAG TPA: phosphoenolpyruvate kinase [Vicinamibacteria bacterium]|nr:phosphoenolpyruvate kinase [Vicinamibacteria bacterium]